MTNERQIEIPDFAIKKLGIERKFRRVEGSSDYSQIAAFLTTFKRPGSLEKLGLPFDLFADKKLISSASSELIQQILNQEEKSLGLVKQGSPGLRIGWTSDSLKYMDYSLIPADQNQVMTGGYEKVFNFVLTDDFENIRLRNFDLYYHIPILSFTEKRTQVGTDGGVIIDERDLNVTRVMTANVLLASGLPLDKTDISKTTFEINVGNIDFETIEKSRNS